ncbi:hypothetical protein [Reinekea forsetii]|jgi:hypothetical protein|uniref:Uncharacterized protein n=1 Tax=Reinekea forsetii TaxID=1336806 RepID=A0A2K8KLF7_9GAMM|nr:hypothetical protein [Reinekea forsetii]ATX75740.1 hypothetical protein REIFOR_00571 [Reinekea forsetii]
MPSTLIRGLKRWHWGGLLTLITLVASYVLALAILLVLWRKGIDLMALIIVIASSTTSFGY